MDDFKPQQPNEPTDKPDDFQATYENKPETYVTPSGEPTTLSAAPQPSLEIPKKKKSGAKKWLLAGLVLVLLAGLGAFAYWQWTDAQNLRNEVSSLKSEVSTLQAATKQADTTDDKEAEAPVELTDAQMAAIEAGQLVESRVNNEFKVEDKNVTVSGSFAKAVATVEGTTEGGYTVILKKLKDSWVAIYGGTTMTTEQKNNLVKEFGVPEALLQ